MIVTVIHDKTKDAFELPIIDIDAHEQTDSWGNSEILYRFEFDISGESHSMSQFDPVGVVVATSDGATARTVDGEVTAVGKNVLVVELYLLPMPNTVTDILNDTDHWVNERVQDTPDDPIPV